MLFWKREHHIQQLIEDYLLEVEHCVATFDAAFKAYFEQGLGQPFSDLIEQIHRQERVADDKRRDLEVAMYDKALIPESRGDILGMVESIDLVPNKCESVLFQIWMQSMRVPEMFVADLRALVATNVATCAFLMKTTRDVFNDIRAVPAGAVKVTDTEAESDHIERRLIRNIFDSSMETADKILLKELVLQIGDVSDRAENAADRLRVIAAKRQS